MRWPARLVSTTSALLLMACASSPPVPPPDAPAEPGVPRPPEVQVQVAGPQLSPVSPIPWRVPRPQLEVHVRTPEAAVRERVRENGAVSEVEVARKRLQGAWSFVYGETIGMAIFDDSGTLVLQALGGDRVSLTFRVLRAPGGGAEAGRLQLRLASDSASTGSESSPGAGESLRRFRALFKWRSAGQVDLQVPAAGERWPREFSRDRYRLFRDVEEAIRFLERRERRKSDAPDLYRGD